MVWKLAVLRTEILLYDIAHPPAHGHSSLPLAQQNEAKEALEVGRGVRVQPLCFQHIVVGSVIYAFSGSGSSRTCFSSSSRIRAPSGVFRGHHLQMRPPSTAVSRR